MINAGKHSITGGKSIIHQYGDLSFQVSGGSAIHESISMPRLTSLPVRLMLPWKMPRLA